MVSTVLVTLLAVTFPPVGEAPAKQPQLATDGRTVAMVYGAGKTILFTRSTDQGRTFSNPVPVATPESLLLNRHRGPRVAFVPGAIVVSAIVNTGDLVTFRSTDMGATWQKGAVINDVPTAAREGLHNLASDGKGTLFADWLDLRDKGTKLYGSKSSDGGVTWSKNVLIYQSADGSICECCHPSATISATGEVLVMWRNTLAGSRDMYLARSKDGVTFGKAEKLGEGTWVLKACPMDGGGVVADAVGNVTTAWRREKQIYLAKPGAKETVIGEGIDVSLAAVKNGVYAVWSSVTGIHLSVPNGTASITLAAKGAYPNILALPQGGALVAWEIDGKIVVEPVK